MIKKTNLTGVKALARSFLMFDPVDTEYSPLVVKHPFTDSGIVGLQEKGGGIRIGNICENPQDLDTWRKQTADMIDRCDSAMQVAFLVTKSYSLGFLKYAQNSLDKDDFAKILAYLWISTEQPNNDPNLSKSKLLAMFKSAEPTALMDDEEFSEFKNLPEIMTVYRGVTSFNAKNVLALSWTLDREKAEWFAHRFGEDGTVCEAQIGKEHVYALFNGRGESEVIVDPKYLQGITQSDDQAEGFSMTM